MLKLLSTIVLVLSLSFSNISILPVSAAEPVLSGRSYILMEMKTGQVLAEKNADERRSPASTTKIMTALVTLENAQPDDIMTATETAINSVSGDYVRAGIKPGEEIKMSDLLNMVLVTSANEAAYVLGENVSPDHTVIGFEAMMNQRAKELGCTDTNFTNPCGIETENHHTTARDLALIGRAAMQIPLFRETVIKTEITMPDTNLRKSDEWSTHLLYTNKLLVSRSKLYTQVTGIKTGYTEPAGRCLVFSAVNAEGMELIGVLLGEPDYDTLFSEAQLLLEYGFANFGMQNLIKSGEYFGKFDVADAVDGTKVTINTKGAVDHLMPRDEETAKSMTTRVPHLPDVFTAPITSGQVLGSYDILVSGKVVGTVELVAENAIEKTTIAKVRDKYEEIMKNPTTLLAGKITVGVIVGLIILRLILRSISRKRNRHRYSSSRKNHYRINQYRK